MRKFQKELKASFNKMQKTNKLFQIDVDRNEVWDLYLSSFSPEDNVVFRDPTSSKYSCKECSKFILRYSNIVAIDDSYNTFNVFTNVKLENIEPEYHNVVKELDKFLSNKKIIDVFAESYEHLNAANYSKVNKKQKTYPLGLPKNTKQYSKEEAELYTVVDGVIVKNAKELGDYIVKPKESRIFYHMSVDLDKKFVFFPSKKHSTLNSYKAEFRRRKEAIEKIMEIDFESFEIYRDFLKSGALVNGVNYLPIVNKVKDLITETELAEQLSNDELEFNNYLWNMATTVDNDVTLFNGSAVAVPLQRIQKGEMSFEDICNEWRHIEDPNNKYKKVKPVTKRMIKDAQKTIDELDCSASFVRRHATVHDIPVFATKFKGVQKGYSEPKLLDVISPTKTTSNNVKFDKALEYSIRDFIDNILPNTTNIELLLENNMINNFFNLTTSANENAPIITKYGNNFVTTFNGGVAEESFIKRAVRKQGGKVDSYLSTRLAWSNKNTDENDNSDLDLHCKFKDGHIFYNKKTNYEYKAMLDIDVINPNSHKGKNRIVAEHIFFNEPKMLKNVKLSFFVHQYHKRGKGFFEFELEIENNTFNYLYLKPMSQGENVKVVDVIFDSKGNYTFKHYLPANKYQHSQTIWGLKTNEFIPVKMISTSPNTWNENNSGNNHWLFFLEGLNNTNDVLSMHNSVLCSELKQHRGVLQELYPKLTVSASEASSQLGGVGFNQTIKKQLKLKVDNRPLIINI